MVLISLHPRYQFFSYLPPPTTLWLVKFFNYLHPPPTTLWLVKKKWKNWNIDQIYNTRAKPQRIVTTRPLCRVQPPVLYLSRLQRILTPSNLKLLFRAITSPRPDRTWGSSARYYESGTDTTRHCPILFCRLNRRGINISLLLAWILA